jgi:wyosine [tRNA(Phe)-imidazoG37] synthetase (radical SAM superfamily)
MKHDFKYLFGPVPSRRFGRSLGVDLTPFKTCSFDCIFCQLGRTTEKTVRRAEYVRVDPVVSELGAWINGGGTADYISLAGSGEPTLNSGFGEVLEFIREFSRIPSALLSNGSLFWQPQVRQAAKRADVVKLSLSAWDEASFVRINRPHPELTFACIMDGYRSFREEYTGKLWLEVFLVEGLNSAPQDVEAIASLAKSIAPDEIHINTAVRPPAEEDVSVVPRERMESLAALFHPRATVISDVSMDLSAACAANEATMLTMLKRRPCTAAQIGTSFGMHLNEVSKYLGQLIKTGEIAEERRGDILYYKATPPETR